MYNYDIGVYIRELRVRAGKTQSEVCRGICSSSTLCKIENGQMAPSDEVAAALLQRFGKYTIRYTTYVNNRKMKLHHLMHEMRGCIARWDYSELQGLLKKADTILKPKDCLERQYMEFVNSIVEERREDSTEAIMYHLLRAICITIPQFTPDYDFTFDLLTDNEVLLINRIADRLYKQGQAAKAILIEMRLKANIEHRMPGNREKSRMYEGIINNLASWLEKEGQFEDAAKMTEEGLRYAVRYGKLIPIPLLLVNLGCSFMGLGKTEQAVFYFKAACDIYMAMGKKKMMQYVISEVKRQYQLQI